jgi:hypothetical protein
MNNDLTITNADNVVADSPTSTTLALADEISLAILAKLPEPLRNEALNWQAALMPLLGNKKGRGLALAIQVQARMGAEKIRSL